MLKTAVFTFTILAQTIVADANERSSSYMSIGVNAGYGSLYYSSSNQNYQHSRTLIIRGNSGQHSGRRNHSTSYGNYYQPRPHHIHRQEGRRYVNDSPCAPVVVVPVTNRYRNRYSTGGYYR